MTVLLILCGLVALLWILLVVHDDRDSEVKGWCQERHCWRERGHEGLHVGKDDKEREVKWW